jgi:serine/threonine-protein kinase
MINAEKISIAWCFPPTLDERVPPQWTIPSLFHPSSYLMTFIMQPPLPLGTTLQNRYHLLSVLGQGGFGRTYLAEDQGRFQELCALKELIPAQGGDYALDKSKELFQREAQTLYQIQHPQIPQFRATFEQDQRLFLVQDYVEGPTYRHLLEQRQAQGHAFSEAEVMQLLRQLLPVLAHIHSKGIIHRDIAPDNIILREQDGKPVLIDFGVVKELATRFQSADVLPQHTTVGKPGYAPIEQMQTGQAYPCSDLYSLAVTAVALLTGKDPQELFDSTTLTWYWQRWVTVSPHFAHVLNRMLSYRAGDRYQSVSEVVQALQSPYVPANPDQAPPQMTVPPSPEPSQMQTMAVGRQADVDPTIGRARRPEPVIEESRTSVWDEPWAVALIGLGLIALTGIGSWAIVRSVLNHQPSPTASETLTGSPSLSPTPTATVTPTPTVTPITYSQQLAIQPDARVTRSGTLKANETVTYIVSGQQAQVLAATVSGEGVLISVLGPNQQPLGDRAQRVSSWQGSLPYTGNYFIQLSPVKGLDKADYQLEVSLKNPASPSPSSSPSPSPSSSSSTAKTIETAQVTFPPGETGTMVSDQTNSRMIKRYLITVSRGQILSVKVSPRNEFLTLDIRYPGGRLIEDASGVREWESQLTRSGDYQIDVLASGDTKFQLDVRVRNKSATQPH